MAHISPPALIIPDERGWWTCPDCTQRYPTREAAIRCGDWCGRDDDEH